MIKLKPCPFCGGEAMLCSRWREGISNRKMFWVKCKVCEVSQSYHSLGGYKSGTRAIRAWNRRANDEHID